MPELERNDPSTSAAPTTTAPSTSVASSASVTSGTSFAPIPQTSPGAIVSNQLVPSDPMAADAKYLLEFSVAAGKGVNAETTAIILQAWDAARQGQLSVAGSIELVKAYGSLRESLGTISTETVRATDDNFGSITFPWARKKASAARIWSRKLASWSIIFAVFSVGVNIISAVLTTFYGLDENTTGWLLRSHIGLLVLLAFLPFAYGALGASVSLLRSAHVHIYERTFDPNRIPEYYNRMLVGAIAGGTIELLVDRVTQDGALIQLSAAALAFVAGYNADLLFKAIERISEALLPKIGVESVRRAGAPAISPVSLPALLDQLDKAQSPEAKEALKGLIGKVKEKM